MRIMRENGIGPLLFALVMIATMIAPCASGDGVVMDYDTIDLVHEDHQTAIIHLAQGYQRMVLSIDIERDGRSVWLFPVPATPDNIALDHGLMKTGLSGEDMKGTAEMEIEDAKDEIVAFQLASIFPMFRVLLFGYGDTMDAGGDIGGPAIHQTLDKEGIHSEVVTSGNGNGLADYLRDRGKDVPQSLDQLIEHYTSMDYSFVVSWINGSIGSIPSIALSFPRTELYYPMVLTSAYGDVVTPVDLIVLDHVTVTNDGLGDIDYKYYNNGRFENQWKESDAFSEFMDLNYWNSKFTMIGIDSKASSYKEDLSFAPYTPKYEENEGFDHNITIFIAFSLFAGAILGFICSTIAFKGEGNERLVFGSLGILNVIAIWIFVLGFLIACITMRKAKASRVLSFIVLFQASYILYMLLFVEYVLFKL